MEDPCKDICEAPMEGTQLPEPEVKLWALDYEILTDPNFRGVAVVGAIDPREAEQLFKAESQHNGVQKKMHIIGIEEIRPKERALQFETYIKVFD
jgi:hypothetical protein